MKKNKTPVKKTAAGRTSTKRPASAAKKSVKTARHAAKAETLPKNMPTGFTRKELEEIKFKLNEMRENLSKNVEDKKNLDMLEPEVGDSIDQATQSLDKEILFELSDNERKTLDNIDASLRKLDNGIYGVCEHCKRGIDKKRLKALPSARYCLPCQSGAEKSRRE
ncbi:MAG: TraR/DksA C4-type zinc finger protein [Elusimicrobiales bacterium]|jgi:DnaK suppressor protein